MRRVEVEDEQIAAYGVPEGRVVSYDEAMDLFHDQCFDLYTPSMFIAANSSEHCKRLLAVVHKHLTAVPY